jgi:hypothetical protein
MKGIIAFVPCTITHSINPELNLDLKNIHNSGTLRHYPNRLEVRSCPETPGANRRFCPAFAEVHSILVCIGSIQAVIGVGERARRCPKKTRRSGSRECG